MNAHAKNLLAEAMTLTPEDRAELASELLASLDREIDEDADAAWAKVIARRVRDVREGRVELIDAEEALQRARARLRAAR